jgi:uncharacterized protein YodC (DUF2158 family)
MKKLSFEKFASAKFNTSEKEQLKSITGGDGGPTYTVTWKRKSGKQDGRGDQTAAFEFEEDVEVDE